MNSLQLMKLIGWQAIEQAVAIVHATRDKCVNERLSRFIFFFFPKILHRLRYSEYKFDLHILNSAGEINAFLQLADHFEDCMTWKVAVRWVIPRKTMHQTQGNFLTEHGSMSSRHNEVENSRPFVYLVTVIVIVVIVIVIVIVTTINIIIIIIIMAHHSENLFTLS